MSGDQLNLDAVMERISGVTHGSGALASKDVPALVAEVRRLRAQVADQQHRLEMAREFSFRVAEERLGIEPPE